MRKHVGMMVPGPAQAAGVVALDDDDHVERAAGPVPRAVSSRLARRCSAWAGVDVALPDGGFYLWFDVGDGWAFTERLARRAGRS